MKNIFIFIFLIFSSCSIWKFDEVIKRKPPHPCPPGTVWLKDNLYIDFIEMPNAGYREYLSWLYSNYSDSTTGVKDSSFLSENYYSQFLDSICWRRQLAYNEPYVELYFRYPAYDFYPVVGVSYEQVQAYCKWRSERVMEMYSAKFGKRKVGIKYPRKVTYRVPTESEWEYAASSGLDLDTFPFGREKIIDKKSNSIFLTKDNYGIDSTFSVTDSLGFLKDILAPCFSFAPNKFGLYNMIGNVAEIVAEKGIAKGGSLNHSLEESQIKKEIIYTQPECWLGFRCICEVEW